MMSDDDKIASSTRKILANYEQIKGKSHDQLGKDKFWDLVVVTAADEAQKLAYELQIKHKLDRHEFPSGLPYHVIADPPGPKIGGGGSVMHTIHELDKIYGGRLEMWRILLINAGGMSQRLPNASALGKIFSPLPQGTLSSHLLDLKLALFLPYLPYMHPGFFHSACDDIVVYDLGEDHDLNFRQPGFTALAHKSSISIGTSHGVYVLKEKKDEDLDRVTETRECLRVLQKPSVELMKETGAVLVSGDQAEPYVYTDSAFFFDHGVAKILHQFYLKEAPLQCELCPYGDYFQPLGPLATMDYTKNTANVAKVEPTLVETREKLFHVFRDVPLNVIAMNVSKFYHIGTIKEFLYHLCEDELLQKLLGLERFVFSNVDPGQDGKLDVEELRKGNGPVPEAALQGVTMLSSLATGSSSKQKSVMEYCNFQCPVTVGSNSIVSHCEYLFRDHILIIPDNIFLHTIPIQRDGITAYVSVAFNTSENIKKKLPPSQCGKLEYFGICLEKVFDILQVKPETVFNSTTDMCSLWNAKLFPAKSSMSESFLSALKFLSSLGICNVEGEHKLKEGEQLYSMHDVLQVKDITLMLAYRDKLSGLISQRKG